MSQVIVIDLPAVEWRPIRPVAESGFSIDSVLLLALLLAVSCMALAFSIGLGLSLAAASIVTLPTMALALVTASYSFFRELSDARRNLY